MCSSLNLLRIILGSLCTYMVLCMKLLLGPCARVWCLSCCDVCWLQVHLDVVILPAWLYLTRQLLQKQMLAEAVMLAVGVVVLALLAGVIYQADQAEKLATQKGRLTPQQAAMRAPASPLVARGGHLQWILAPAVCVPRCRVVAAMCLMAVHQL